MGRSGSERVASQAAAGRIDRASHPTPFALLARPPTPGCQGKPLADLVAGVRHARPSSKEALMMIDADFLFFGNLSEPQHA